VACLALAKIFKKVKETSFYDDVSFLQAQKWATSESHVTRLRRRTGRSRLDARPSTRLLKMKRTMSAPTWLPTADIMFTPRENAS
jgi:hypothetical protein